MMDDLESLRAQARHLLRLDEPADALYAYYALYYDPRRTRLYIHTDAGGRADGFVAVCQTGQRLFQPTVLLRTPDARAAVVLLRQALLPGRPYYLITTPDLQDAVAEVAEIENATINRVYKLDLFRFQPTINVLVVTEAGPGGLPRFVVRAQDAVVAEAGFNWASAHFAEVFVRTAPSVQERGWGKAVLTACTMWTIRSAIQPLYVTDRTNEASIALAESAGYVDTGAREYACDIVRRLPAATQPHRTQIATDSTD